MNINKKAPLPLMGKDAERRGTTLLPDLFRRALIVAITGKTGCAYTCFRRTNSRATFSSLALVAALAAYGGGSLTC